MPLYLYKCTACSREEEMLVSIKDYDVIQRCPICHSEMEHALTRPAGYAMDSGPASSPNSKNFSSIKAKK